VGAVINECNEVPVAMVRGSREWATNIGVHMAKHVFSACCCHLADHLSGLFPFKAWLT
jgi:hypothetical protein